MRDGILHDITAAYPLTGARDPLARYFGAGREEQLDIAAALEEGGREEVVTALFLHLAARDGVVRRYREGEAVVDRRRGVVTSFLALRRFGHA